MWGPEVLRHHLWDNGLLSGWSSDWFGGFPAYRFYVPVPALSVLALDLVVPYGVALKLTVAVAFVLLPAAVSWSAFRAAGLAAGGAAIVAATSLVFVFDDDSYYSFGGNAASTIAGEYGNTLGLLIGLVALTQFPRALS